jgi:cytochrome c-type biogenesis protein CcmE
MSESTMPRRRRPILLTGAILVLLAGFGWLAVGSVGENLVYFLTPSELLAKGTAGYDTPVRVGGMVVPGTIQWDAKALDLRFQVTDGKARMAVHSKGAPPQMFQDSMGVVLEGRYKHSGVFESTSLMVKHSNEYRPPKEGEKPAQIYKDLPVEGRAPAPAPGGKS